MWEAYILVDVHEFLSHFLAHCLFLANGQERRLANCRLPQLEHCSLASATPVHATHAEVGIGASARSKDRIREKATCDACVALGIPVPCIHSDIECANPVTEETATAAQSACGSELLVACW